MDPPGTISSGPHPHYFSLLPTSRPRGIAGTRCQRKYTVIFKFLTGSGPPQTSAKHMKRGVPGVPTKASTQSVSASSGLTNSNDAMFAELCRRVLPIIWVGYVMNILDRTNLGFAVLQMSADLKLTPQSFGLNSAVFFLSYGLMQVPSNHLCKSVGPVKVLACSMVTWGIISTATAWVWNGFSLMIFRFSLGLAESAFYPGCLYLLTCWFPEEFLGRAVAYFATATSVGGILSTAGR